MIACFNHTYPWIFVGPFLVALAACPQKDAPETTDAPETEATTSAATTSTTTTTTTDPTTSGQPGTSTGETTAPSEPETTSTTSSSTTTLDPDTTGGDTCPVDLAAALALGFEQCDQSLVLIATVQNVGTVDAPAGVDVTFHEGTDGSGIKLGTKPTTEPLPAGSSTDVVWVIVAPPAGESNEYFVEVSSIGECDETNNTALVTDAACPN